MEIGVGVLHWELEAILEVLELLVVLNVLDDEVLEDSGTWVVVDGFELREGIKKHFIGRLIVLLLVVVVLR